MVERLAAEGLLTPNNGALDPGAQTSLSGLGVGFEPGS